MVKKIKKSIIKKKVASTNKAKWVYNFEDTPRSDKQSLKNLLGGKGANLSEMIRISLPVPPGFTITTEACNEFYSLNQKYPSTLKNQVSVAIKKVEQKIKKLFGNESNPLLVSVRSGARVSMPGMMDTVLNLGLNDKTVIGLAKKTNNETFA
jgi:pyruvate, orthophosphate dikinase